MITEEKQLYASGMLSNMESRRPPHLNEESLNYTCLGVPKEKAKTRKFHHVADIQEPVLNVSASDSHTLVLTTFGNVYGFGRNYYGQLGLPENKDCYKPTLLSKFKECKQVLAHENSSVALRSDGSVLLFKDRSKDRPIYASMSKEMLRGKLFKFPTPVEMLCLVANTIIAKDKEGNIFDIFEAASSAEAKNDEAKNDYSNQSRFFAPPKQSDVSRHTQRDDDICSKILVIILVIVMSYFMTNKSNDSMRPKF